MKALLKYISNPWLLSVLIFYDLSIAWSLQAQFGMPTSDGSVWGTTSGLTAAIPCSYLFCHVRKRGMKVREAIEFAIASLLVFANWTLWLAPRIWNYADVVKFPDYYKITLVYWLGFLTFFLLGIAIFSSRFSSKK